MELLELVLVEVVVVVELVLELEELVLVEVVVVVEELVLEVVIVFPSLS